MEASTRPGHSGQPFGGPRTGMVVACRNRCFLRRAAGGLRVSVETRRPGMGAEHVGGTSEFTADIGDHPNERRGVGRGASRRDACGNATLVSGIEGKSIPLELGAETMGWLEGRFAESVITTSLEQAINWARESS